MSFVDGNPDAPPKDETRPLVPEKSRRARVREQHADECWRRETMLRARLYAIERDAIDAFKGRAL